MNKQNFDSLTVLTGEMILIPDSTDGSEPPGLGQYPVSGHVSQSSIVHKQHLVAHVCLCLKIVDLAHSATV